MTHIKAPRLERFDALITACDNAAKWLSLNSPLSARGAAHAAKEIAEDLRDNGYLAAADKRRQFVPRVCSALAKCRET